MSTKFLLPCTNCDQKIPVQPSQAGDSVTCSACQTVVPVPTMSAIRKLEAVQEQQKKVKKREWSTGQGALFAAGLLLIIAGVGIGGSFTYLVATADTDSRIDIEMEKIGAEIDDFGPARTLTIWAELEKPLDDWEESALAKRRRVAESQKTYSLVGYAIAGLGLCATVGAFFLKPQRRRPPARRPQAPRKRPS